MRSVHLVPLLPQIECVGGVVGAEPDLHFADHRDRSAAVDQRPHADGLIDFIADLQRRGGFQRGGGGAGREQPGER